MDPKLTQLQNDLGVFFRDETILKNALIHRSYLNEFKKYGQKLISNERLEFLGDAVLELWISQKLYQLFPDQDEGFLTNLRSKVVKTESLAKLSQKLKLGDYLFLGKGEDRERGRNNPSILADAFEALLGAVFLDQGITSTFSFLEEAAAAIISEAVREGELKDPKTLFQEKIQARQGFTPSYRLVKQEGPDHRRIFTVSATVDEKEVAIGQGKSKQEAEQAAAKEALAKMFPGG